MATATSQDTEITLGTGKMLALFFGLVALCAVFFGWDFRWEEVPFESRLPTSPLRRRHHWRPAAFRSQIEQRHDAG